MLSVVASSDSPSGRPSILQQVMQDEIVLNAIRNALEDAGVVADADRGPFQLKMQNAILFSFKSIEFLGTYLVGDLGWEREEIDNHARFYSQPGQYSKIVRIIFCKAKYYLANGEPHFKSRAKGIRWKELVNENKIQLQLGLDPAFMDDSIRTLCVFATHEDGVTEAYLADPIDCTKHGQTSILKCSDARRILYGVANNTPFISEDSVDVDIDIEEIDNEATG